MWNSNFVINNHNFKRFLMAGNTKVMTELCLLALSQNIVKYIAKCNKNQCKTRLLFPIPSFARMYFVGLLSRL